MSDFFDRCLASLMTPPSLAPDKDSSISDETKIKLMNRRFPASDEDKEFETLLQEASHD